jgi:hypothetical protein
MNSEQSPFETGVGSGRAIVVGEQLLRKRTISSEERGGEDRRREHCGRAHSLVAVESAREEHFRSLRRIRSKVCLKASHVVGVGGEGLTIVRIHCLQGSAFPPTMHQSLEEGKPKASCALVKVTICGFASAFWEEGQSGAAEETRRTNLRMRRTMSE